jgi:RNA polymerase sigma factor (TIGR02999 family)
VAEGPLDPALYSLLKDIARSQLRRERADHTLQPTALVHEAWMRLADGSAESRVELLARAATAMRRVLVDHARRTKALRRSSGKRRVTLHDDAVAEVAPEVDVLELDEALDGLAALDDRQARIVELRFFAGLDASEVAQVLGISRRTVQGDWNMARAFLRHHFGRGATA